MIYGEEKVRQMSRSILPSTARKKARREKRLIARGNRRGVNFSLHEMARDPESWDGMLLPGDGWSERKELSNWTIRERRDADKLNHFEKWAASRTSHLPKGRRLDAIRPILPAGLIGWHAATHLSFLDQFEKLETGSFASQPERYSYLERLGFRFPAKQPSWSRSQLIEQLELVATDPSALAELNQLLRQEHRTCYEENFNLVVGEEAERYSIGPSEPPQMGTNGVSSFVDQLLHAHSTKDAAHCHREWLVAVKSFLMSS